MRLLLFTMNPSVLLELNLMFVFYVDKNNFFLNNRNKRIHKVLLKKKREGKISFYCIFFFYLKQGSEKLSRMQDISNCYWFCLVSKVLFVGKVKVFREDISHKVWLIRPAFSVTK